MAFAGRLATDLGADVTIVDGAAWSRRRVVEPLLDGVGTSSHFLDAGKTVVAADRAQATLDAADIVLTDAATPLKGEAIWTVVSLRPADTGAHHDSEFTLLAACGLLDLVGDPAREPLRLGGHQLAYAGGLAAYLGFSAALCARDAGKPTGAVRVNLADVAVWLNWKSVASADWGTRLPTRLGEAAEWRTVRCADGWVALVYLEADWPVLRELVGDARLADPAFDNRTKRRANAAFIAGIVETFFEGLTRSELRDMALQKRLPLGAVWSPAELEQDPQYKARGFLSRSQRHGVPVLRPAAPVIWNGQRFGIEAAA